MAGNSSNERRSADPSTLDYHSELLELMDLLIDVIFCMKSFDGVYVAVNSAFVRRTGRASKREVIGFGAGDLFLAELAERYEAQDEQVLETGKPLRDELELIRREDGSLGWYLTTKLPVAAAVEGDPGGVISVSRDLKVPRDEDEDVQALSRVVELVRGGLDSPLRVTDVAADVGLSPAQLERRMKKAFGISTSKYVLRARVDRATELLTDTGLTLADIAVRCGFYDQADLTHRFARLTNETPAQFRAKQRDLNR